MKDTQQLLAALGKPFSKEAVKSRVGGGGSRFDYVAGFTVIHRLNDATGGQWDWHIHSFEFRPLPPDKYGKEQSLVVVTGELTIPGLGTRAGIGVQKVSENGGEDLVKGASTDALKKAATLFGVALELYGEDFEDEDHAPAPQPQRQQPQRPTPASNGTPAPAANGGTFVKYSDPGHTASYAPQQAVREELAARRGAQPATSPAITRDADWTDVWSTARPMGIKDRAALDQWLGGEGAQGLLPWQILARLKEAAAPAAPPPSH